MKISDKIVEIRKLKGLTQEELAEKSNISLRTLQRIENDQNEPRGKTLHLICEALGTNFDDLSPTRKTSPIHSPIFIWVNALFLLLLNMVLMTIIGYMTIDSEANLNSRLGGLLLSFFISIFIVFLTTEMNGLRRLLFFGSGYILYFVLFLAIHGFVDGFISALFPCLLIATAT